MTEAWEPLRYSVLGLASFLHMQWLCFFSKLEAKEDTKGRGVGARKRSYNVGGRNGHVGRQRFPHSGCIKLGMPPTLLPGRDGRIMVALSVRGRVGKINIKLFQ